MSNTSILIAIPALDVVPTDFLQHVIGASATIVAEGFKFNCAINIGSVITIARRNLVQAFLSSGFDYIWWLDSDMIFPPDTAIKLLKRNKDIIGVNYRKRRFPDPKFTAMTGTIGNYNEYKTLDNSPSIDKVDVLPHGCMLVKREVYEKIQEPHYIQPYLPNLKIEVGEDVYFCDLAKKNGYTLWCDNDLSKEVSHIGTFHFNYNLTA